MRLLFLKRVPALRRGVVSSTATGLDLPLLVWDTGVRIRVEQSKPSGTYAAPLADSSDGCVLRRVLGFSTLRDTRAWRCPGDPRLSVGGDGGLVGVHERFRAREVRRAWDLGRFVNSPLGVPFEGALGFGGRRRLAGKRRRIGPVQGPFAVQFRGAYRTRVSDLASSILTTAVLLPTARKFGATRHTRVARVPLQAVLGGAFAVDHVAACPKARRLLGTVNGRDGGNSHGQTYGRETMGGGLGARTIGRRRG